MGNDDLVRGAIDESVTRLGPGRREGMDEERVVNVGPDPSQRAGRGWGWGRPQVGSGEPGGWRKSAWSSS